MGMAIDPMQLTDMVLDSALAAHAESVQIAPATEGGYSLTFTRQGELLAKVPLDIHIAALVIARLGFVCGVDPADRRAKTGRTRVRSCDEQSDMIVTIQSSPARAEVVFVPPVRANAEPQIGERIGHYRVIAPLGAGGMGNVYEVVHERLGRRHALKVLQTSLVENDRASIERFL